MTRSAKMIRRAMILFLVLAIFIIWALWHQPAGVQPLPSRYVKIDAQGEAIDDWAGPWACVLDRETGLLWEVKTDSETIHDAYWSYSWFDGETGHANGGDCYFEPERCDTLDLVRRTNKQGLCGLSRWRLPTSDELASLVSEQGRPGQAKIAHAYFPHTHKGDYWSAEGKQKLSGHYQHLQHGARTVSFLDGTMSSLPYRNAAFVRLVIKDAELSY